MSHTNIRLEQQAEHLDLGAAAAHHHHHQYLRSIWVAGVPSQSRDGGSEPEQPQKNLRGNEGIFFDSDVFPNGGAGSLAGSGFHRVKGEKEVMQQQQDEDSSSVPSQPY